MLFYFMSCCWIDHLKKQFYTIKFVATFTDSGHLNCVCMCFGEIIQWNSLWSSSFKCVYRYRFDWQLFKQYIPFNLDELKKTKFQFYFSFTKWMNVCLFDLIWLNIFDWRWWWWWWWWWVGSKWWPSLQPEINLMFIHWWL